MQSSRIAVALATAAILFVAPLSIGTAWAAGPDIEIVDLFDTERWGQVGDIVGYSIGTEICNQGDENALWIAETNEHPVIAQNMYRHKDGRIEQIGMSWLKHGFTSVNGNACDQNCNNPGTGDLLGVGCSDPYSSGLNGDQGGFGGISGLGPRFQVNAATGVYEFPYFAQGQDGNAIYKRLQVHEDDLDGAMNPGATYFVEGQYVTADDAQAGNGANNVSYREVSVSGNNNLSFEAPTVEGIGAIYAWQAINPDVDIRDIDIENDGRVTVASRAIDLGGGQWRYEYAVHNNNSHRSGHALEVLVPDGVAVSNIGFHDVDYHSGEPVVGTDWSVTAGSASVVWATDSFDVSPTANALRWGSMYNFRFDADAPPATSTAAMELYRPGTPTDWSALVIGPNNQTGEPLLNVAGSCPGDAAAAIENLTPSSDVTVFRGTGPGQSSIPSGPCAGVDLGIANAELIATFPADQDGAFRAEPQLGAPICGAFVQAVDLSTCDLSNAVELPSL